MELLKPYLEDLESRIDPEIEKRLIAEWRAFTDGTFEGGIFTPQRQASTQPGIDWPEIAINHALVDKELMLLRELKSCSQSLANGGGALLNIRANYGTSILSSPFGVEIFYMEESMNTLPTNHPLPGGPEKIRELVNAGIPDFKNSFAQRALEWADYARQTLSGYPNINTYVQLYHPDAQGPMDVCELIWGSSLFVDAMDDPALVKAFLELITRTYAVYMREWSSRVPLTTDYSPHWGLMHKGALMIRDDSAMNFSPNMFEEFIRPYDQELLNEFGGGAIHFCGMGSHYIRSMCSMDNLFAVNLSQPSYNDMETIYQNTVDKDIKLLGLDRTTAEAAIKSGRDLRSNVHCW